MLLTLETYTISDETGNPILELRIEYKDGEYRALNTWDNENFGQNFKSKNKKELIITALTFFAKKELDSASHCQERAELIYREIRLSNNQ